jgi:hypothetical protein
MVLACQNRVFAVDQRNAVPVSGTDIDVFTGCVPFLVISGH